MVISDVKIAGRKSVTRSLPGAFIHHNSTHQLLPHPYEARASPSTLATARTRPQAGEKKPDLPDHLHAFDNTRHGAQTCSISRVQGNIYTRIVNPDWDVLEKRIAAMEGGIAGLGAGLGAGGDHLRHPDHCRSRRQHRLGIDALRRHLQPVRAHAAAIRHRGCALPTTASRKPSKR